jgi:hypothetical protein
LTTSTHTSLAAACAPARSPLAALLQIPSSLPFTVAESVVAFCTADLQAATAAANVAALVVPVVPTVLVEVVVADVAVLAFAVELLVVLVAGVLAAVVVELLVVELLLPHPARSAPHSSGTTSSERRVAIICPPSIWRAPHVAVGTDGASVTVPRLSACADAAVAKGSASSISFGRLLAYGSVR